MKANDLRLVFIFIILSSLILLKSYFNANGYISPDSAKYLQLAQNLSDGNGLYVTDLSNPQGKTFFAIWPLGYPFMIFIVAKLTTLSVFWASKILNIFFIALCFILFRMLFKEKAFWFTILFFTNSIFETFTYTWSEVPFIFGLLWFCISLQRFFIPNNWDGKSISQPFLPILNIFLSSLFLFFCRYVGVFSFGIIGILAIFYLLKKNYRYFINFTITLFLLILIAGAYLYINKINTGYFTGGERLFSDWRSFATSASVLKKLFLSQSKEFIFFNLNNHYKFYVLAFALIAELSLFVYLFFNLKRKSLFTLHSSLFTLHSSKIFFYVGLFYWLTIVFTRFILQFDPIDFRLLSPSTFMFGIALISYLINRFSIPIIRDRKSLSLRFEKSLLFSILILLSIYLIPNKKYLYDFYILKNTDWRSFATSAPIINYETNIKNIKAQFSSIPSNSLVLMGNIHVNYLRDDITVCNQLFRENMNGFIKRSLNNSSAQYVFIQIHPNLNKNNNDQTIRNYMYEHKDKVFVRLK